MIGRLALAVALCLAASGAANAQSRRMLYAIDGVPLRISYYSWFSYNGCKSLGLPHIVNMRSASGARIWTQPEDLPLGYSSSKEGERCIGKLITSAAVYYLARSGFDGDDTVDFFVRYPSTCANCKSHDVSVKVRVLPKTSPDTIDTETTTGEAR